jgi:RNA polymerase sigma-70 factor (ECF subfamily)
MPPTFTRSEEIRTISGRHDTCNAGAGSGHDSSVEDRQGAFERLYNHYSPDLAMYALRRTDRETAQDVVAETFTVAWRRLDDVPASAPLPWLYGIARRVLANQRRSAARLAALRERLEREGTAAPQVADRALAEALRHLSESDRELLMLVAWEGLSSAEAAVALGCSNAACRVRLHRARRRLAAALEGFPDLEKRLAKEAW